MVPTGLVHRTRGCEPTAGVPAGAETNAPPPDWIEKKPSMVSDEPVTGSTTRNRAELEAEPGSVTSAKSVVTPVATVVQGPALVWISTLTGLEEV